ncbi:hypothetical protein KAH55_10095, partial [bacterium]|nr:hypothetical protein [bacterium]
IHSFEPRNVPDTLLEKYPMLRGGRVDHPFRSLKPRYGLALAHPFVRLHYKELIQNLLKEVPDLGYMSIVTNDSGAGLEFTRSLYVGSNGGPYLIREWKSVDEVAQAAAKNAMAFFKLLQKSGAEINPKFRVMMPLERFGQEREYILKEVGHGIDVQGASFQNAGDGSAYHHENYEDVTSVQGTAWQTTFNADEKEFMDFMKQRDGRAHVVYSHGLYNNLDPLVGIPYPRMLYKKMKAMHDTGAEYVVNAGGLNPPSLAPWNINNEVSRVFQHNPAMDLDEIMKITAARWVGAKSADTLVTAWNLTQEAVAAYPPVGLYSMVAMNWYRFWARPLVPNIEAISEEDREYYERYLLAPPHNPTRVDLNRDVLFDLGTEESARINVDRIDAN